MRCWCYCFIMLILAGCSKNDSSSNGATQNTLLININSVVKDQALVLKDSLYTNAAGQPFNVTAFKYYLSNFTLTNADKKTITLTNNYYLVNEADSNSKKLLITGIPDGSYTSVSFLIGVDSLHNVSGAQTGALDVLNGMFWSWNSGYIMAKMEGTSSASSATANLLQFHIGGFSAPYNALRTVTLALAQPQVWSGGTHTVRMKADVYTWFDVPNQINFKELPVTMEPNANAVKIADNYSQMFTITSITTP